MSEINFKNISKTYAGSQRAVIHNVNLQINEAEFCVFVGPSGCGKSTLLRMVAGLEDISSGELRIQDQLVNDVPPSDRGVAMVFQSYALYPHMAAGAQALSIATNPGQALDIQAQFTPGNASAFGLKVRTGSNGEETVVGYDAVAGEVYIDRTQSGDASFDASFKARHTAPLPLRTGVVDLRIVVDTSSVMVFAGHEVVLTDQIFPHPSSNGVALFAEGGEATLKDMKIWPLKSIWADR